MWKIFKECAGIILATVVVSLIIDRYFKHAHYRAMIVPGICCMVTLGCFATFLFGKGRERISGLIVATLLSGSCLASFSQYIQKLIKLNQKKPFLDVMNGAYQNPETWLHLAWISISLLLIFIKLSPYLASLRPVIGRGRRVSPKKALGGARFANSKELKPLLNETGIVLGQTKSHANAPLIRLQIEGHGLTIAPPRSGKFTSSISSNLAIDKQSWQGSIVSIGPKGEEYAVWAKHRIEMGRKVVLLDPFGIIKTLGKKSGRTDLIETQSARINPLDTIDHTSPSMIKQIGVIMDALVEPPHLNASAESRHFNDAARRIISGLIAWVACTETSEKRSLTTVKTLLNQNHENLIYLLEELAASEYGYGLPRDAAALLLNVGERERGSFFSTVSNALDFLKFPEIAESISSSDFNLRDLMDGNLDLFIVNHPSLSHDIKPWIRLLISMIIEQFHDHKPKQRVLMLIDEITTLGRIEAIRKSFNLMAGYGLSIWGFTQTWRDLVYIYGQEEAKAMLSMAEFVQFYNISATDKDTQDYVSALLGDATFLTKSKTASNNFMAGSNQSGSTSMQESKQRLVPPEEIARLPFDSQIVFIRKKDRVNWPIFCWKAHYYQKQHMSALANKNPFLAETDSHLAQA